MEDVMEDVSEDGGRRTLFLYRLFQFGFHVGQNPRENAGHSTEDRRTIAFDEAVVVDEGRYASQMPDAGMKISQRTLKYGFHVQ